MKECRKCGEIKALEEFPKSSRPGDEGGRGYWCLICHRAYYADNRARMRAQQKANRLKDRELTRARDRAKNAKLAADPRRLEYKRRANGKRRARLTKLPSEDVDPKVVFKRDKGVCGICCQPVDTDDWHMDHIVPLAAGGPHTYGNLQVSHPRCNLSKGSRLAA